MVDQVPVNSWPFGTRVRCVDGAGYLVDGREYVITADAGYFVHVNDFAGPFYRTRFKPVVRVKAGRAALQEAGR